MAVFRVEKNKGYTVMSNHHLRNPLLSLKSKGLLSQMLSLPDDWDYTLKGLSKINRESIDAIRTAIWELEQAGYIVRHQTRDAKGRLAAIEYTIYEQPKLDEPVSDKPLLENPTSDNPTTENPTLENPTQLNKEILNTKSLNTDVNNLIYSYPEEQKKRLDEKDVSVYEQLIKENIEYDTLVLDDHISIEKLDEIVEIMLDTICSTNDTITIAGNKYPAEIVKSRFLKLNSSHILYVFECMDQNTSKVHNIKKYLMAVLYNAPATIDSYYSALVNHDLYREAT